MQLIKTTYDKSVSDQGEETKQFRRSTFKLAS